MSDQPLTLLVISGPGMPPWAARGLTQSLDPIDASGNLQRTVNGALLDLSPSQMRKYKSTISCNDMDVPAFDGLWPGMVLTVDCVPELGYLTTAGAPQRTVVTGSSRTSNAWTFYRPQLTMRVMSYTVSHDEYGCATSWQLDLEEI